MFMINHNLKIFLKVAELMSITEAAKELYISQPAVSKAIKIIEDELQVKLFHRDKRRGIHLTDSGEKILHHVRQLADVENHIYQTAYNENNFFGGRVKIASVPTLTTLILAPVLEQYKERYPHVTVEITEGNLSEITSTVQGYNADLGLMAAPFSDLDAEILFTDEIVAISASPFSSDPVSLLRSEERLILCRSGQETAFDLLKGSAVPLSKALLVEEPATVARFVSCHHGMGLLARLALDILPHTLYTASTDPAITYDIGLVAPDLHDLTPAAEALRKMIEEYVREQYGDFKSPSDK